MEHILNEETHTPVHNDAEAQEEASNWNAGCEKDDVRNEFIIPTLAKVLTQFQPSRVLDVGTGTAYIAREVDSVLQYRPFWTAIDLLSARVSLAIKMKPKHMNMEALVLSFDEIAQKNTKYDAILLIFTLLEIKKLRNFFDTVQGVISDDGIVCIAMPNSLEDVYNAAVKDASVLQDYMNDCCVLDKIDKFTGKKYPFNAHRFECIVKSMVQAGFNMIDMVSRHTEDHESYLLVFQKKKAAI